MSRRARREINGVLVVDKPAGLTSAQVVAGVRKRLGTSRVGHTGTLDPLATGVLPLCLGEATKLAGYLLADDKAYEADLELGVETDTLDSDGEVVRSAPAAAAAVTEADLRAVIDRFVGAIAQVPPMYSAIKVDGRRLHKLARTGIEIEREARSVVVHRLALLAWDPPRARIAVACSKGTYVRSLVADLGSALGCGAHLTGLRRTQSGTFGLHQAVPLDAVTREHLISLPDCLDLPRFTVPATLYRSVLDGRALTLECGIVPHLQHPWQPRLQTVGSDTSAAVAPSWQPQLQTVAEVTSDDDPSSADASQPRMQMVAADTSDLVQLLTPEGALLALARQTEVGLHPIRVFTYGLTELASSANLRRSIGSNP